MATTDFLIWHSPIRIGWLVRQGNTDDLLRAIEFSTVLAGGVFNPIIPIGAGVREDPKDLVARMGIDVVAPVADALELERFEKEHRFLKTPLRPNGPGISFLDHPSKRRRSVFLDVAYQYQKFWEDEASKSPTVRHGIVPKWDKDDECATALAVAFGQYPAEDEYVVDYLGHFVRSVSAEPSHVAIGGDIPESWGSKRTPLMSTALGLQVTLPGLSSLMFGFYFGDHTSFDSLVGFWNLRASGHLLQFVSTKVLSRYTTMVQGRAAAFLERSRKLALIAVEDNGVSPDVVRGLVGSEYSLFDFPCSNKGPFRGVSSMRAAFGRRDAIGHLDVSTPERPMVSVILPTDTFATDISATDQRQQLALELTSFGDHLYDGATLRPPHRPDLHEQYSREIVFDPWKLRSVHDGLRVFSTLYNKTLNLRPIRYVKILEALLERAGIQSTRSQAGLLTDKIIERFGGLEDARIFKIRGVRKLLDGLSPADAITKGNATSHIYNEGQFKDHEELFIEPRRSGFLKADQAFEHLLKKDVFRAGLQLICEQCQLDSWHGLPSIDDFWDCEFCGQRNRTSLQLNSRGDWKFRKSGLFARNNNQEGAIPVILTMQCLSRVLGGMSQKLNFASSLKFSGEGIDSEVDLVALGEADEGGVEILLCESKSAGGVIEEDDIKKLLLIRERLEKIEVRTVLGFSKTAEDFTPGEKDLFRKLHADGVRLFLFTRRELEANDGPYWDASDVPNKYPHASHELAANAFVRYLR